MRETVETATGATQQWADRSGTDWEQSFSAIRGQDEAAACVDTLGRLMRVVVRLNGERFRVPVQESVSKVQWLLDESARRYERLFDMEEGSVNIKELRGSDGSLIDRNDRVMDACEDNEEVQGIIVLQRDSAVVDAVKSDVHAASTTKGSERADIQMTRNTSLSALLSHGRGAPAVDEWYLQSEEADVTFRAHSAGVTCIQMLSDCIVTGGRDQRVVAWSNRGSMDYCIETNSLVRALEVSSVHLGFAAGNNVTFVSRKDGTELWKFDTHRHFVSCMQITGQKIVSGSWDCSLCVHDLDPPHSTLRQLKGHSGGIVCLSCSGDRCVSGDLNGELRLWDLNSGECISSAKAGNDGSAVFSVLWLGRSIFAAVGTNIIVFDVAGLSRCSVMSGHTDIVCSLAADGPLIYSASRDHSVRIWHANSHETLKSFPIEGARCLCVSSQYFCVGTDSGDVHIWKKHVDSIDTDV